LDFKIKARDFFEKAKSSNDEFAKYIYFYIAFEILYKSKFKNFSNLEEDQTASEMFFEIVNKDKIQELKDELHYEPQVNMKNKRDTSKLSKSALDKDFSEIVKFLRRTRNNLFHGDKGMSSRRDKFIIKYGNFLLEPLVIVLLEY